MANEAVIKNEDKGVEFIPHGSQDKVKLTIAMVRNLIAVKTKSGKTCSDQDAIKFVAMCQARRLNPFEGDAFLIGYDGKDGPTFSLITAHQAFLKRAETNVEYDGMKSGIIVEQDGEMKDLEGDFYTENQKVVGGWATVYFKNRKQPMHKRIRLKRFQKSFGVWADDSAGMICKCAEADALRSSFPTLLGGLYLKEELVPTEPKVSAPIFTEPPKVAEKKEKPAVDAEVIPAKEAMAEPVGAPAPHDTSFNALKYIRSKIKAAKLEEKDVLNALVEIGTIEADVEDLGDVEPDTLALLADQFEDIATKIKQAQGE
jgi:phage recombination protein Bet